MKIARQGNTRRAVATGGAVALLMTMAACGGGGDETPASAPAPSAEATVDPSANPSASSAPAVNGQNIGTGTGVVDVRAAHLASFSWNEKEKKDLVMQLIKEKKLDTVQLDIKDEDGLVGYDSKIPLVTEAHLHIAGIGYDLNQAVQEIHDAGAKVVGRIVAFRDPRLGKWASSNGHMDYVIQNTSGGPYNAGSYGTAAFTNFANPDVVEYNIALAEEAAKAGFDGIMYDYVRKPENTGQVYVGIGDKTPSQAIADFVAQAEPRVHAAGASLGAAVFGVAAFTPDLIAQNIPLMAPHLDFLSPMIYPSHWGKGEYSVANPVAQPYDIYKRSLMDFNRLVLGTDCAIVPWVQNFTYPSAYPYGAEQVGAQIKAAHDVGINSFYLWNDSSKVAQGAGALTTHEWADNAPGQRVYSINKPGNNSEGTTDQAKAKMFIDAYQAWVAGGKQGTFVSPLDATAAPTSAATSAPEPSATP
ncbi:MAG TPA: putative glycoside hydrolase [Sporichthya sp.]|nr:putative glycoside hydrolase [Sporichthya sp.]